MIASFIFDDIAMKTKLIIVFIAILQSVLFFSGCNDGSSLRVTDWQILNEQSDSIELISQKNGWRPVAIPGTFKMPYAPIMAFQYVWLRGEFNIDSSPSDYYGISIGRIRYSDRVYINKHLVGSLPSKKVNWTPLPRHYKIPAGVLSKGKNEVYIQLGIYGKSFGGILSDVLIQHEDEFDWTKFVNNFLFKQLPVGIVLLFSILVIILLIVYLLDTNEKLPFYSSLLPLFSIAYIFLPISSYRLISYELFLAIQMALTPLFLILFIMLIQSVYTVYLSYQNRITIPVLLLFITIIILSRNESYNLTIGVILVILSLVIAIPYFIYMIRSLYLIKKDKFITFMISLVTIIAFSIMLFEGYTRYFEGLYTELISIYVPPVFIIIGAVVVTKETIRRKVELELVYEQLKSYRVKEVSITDSSEEKLKRIEEFIKKNFTSNLSREGLAIAVGIHPNYMSTLFKTYTGKNINEYINHLRIEEAKKRLDDKDLKIIDIAYAVGFESLVTFNRAFKKETGKTPSEYRNGLLESRSS